MNQNSQNKSEKKTMEKVNGKVVKRLLSYIGQYKLRFTLVLICILISALTSVASSLYLETLIDDYITPLLLEAAPVFTPLLRSVLFMGCIYLAGVVATLLYNRLMVVIAQGILKDIRDSMFAKMQTLPIRYFDTHAHGDIMSHYTNDTDTLRQMMAQSIPQMFSSMITIVSVFCNAVYQLAADHICADFCIYYAERDEADRGKKRLLFYSPAGSAGGAEWFY